MKLLPLFLLFILSNLFLTSCDSSESTSSQEKPKSSKPKGLDEEQRRKILSGIYGDSTFTKEEFPNSSEELFNQISLGDSDKEVAQILTGYKTKDYSTSIYSGIEYEGLEFLRIPGSFKYLWYGEDKKISIKRFEFQWTNHKSKMTQEEFFKYVTKIIKYVDSNCEVMTGAKMPGIDAGLSTERVLIGGGTIEWKNKNLKHQILLTRVNFMGAEILGCNYSIER